MWRNRARLDKTQCQVGKYGIECEKLQSKNKKNALVKQREKKRKLWM